jgi:hypothetical protein
MIQERCLYTNPLGEVKRLFGRRKKDAAEIEDRRRPLVT